MNTLLHLHPNPWDTFVYDGTDPHTHTQKGPGGTAHRPKFKTDYLPVLQDLSDMVS